MHLLFFIQISVASLRKRPRIESKGVESINIRIGDDGPNSSSHRVEILDIPNCEKEADFNPEKNAKTSVFFVSSSESICSSLSTDSSELPINHGDTCIPKQCDYNPNLTTTGSEDVFFDAILNSVPLNDTFSAMSSEPIINEDSSLTEFKKYCNEVFKKFNDAALAYFPMLDEIFKVFTSAYKQPGSKITNIGKLYSYSYKNKFFKPQKKKRLKQCIRRFLQQRKLIINGEEKHITFLLKELSDVMKGIGGQKAAVFNLYLPQIETQKSYLYHGTHDIPTMFTLMLRCCFIVDMKFYNDFKEGSACLNPFYVSHFVAWALFFIRRNIDVSRLFDKFQFNLDLKIQIDLIRENNSTLSSFLRKSITSKDAKERENYLDEFMALVEEIIYQVYGYQIKYNITKSRATNHKFITLCK